ncbi:MAG: ABC transporter ATP-binding protein [Pseudomonadota bacterium]
MIELRSVYKIYRQGRETIRAVDGLSLTIQAGEFLLINGKSGCGKSTLLGLIGGLDTPTSGDILFDGRNLSTMSDPEISGFRRKNVGTVFQAYNLIPILSVEENVGLPLLLDGHSRITVKHRVRELLEEVELSHRAGHNPHELSGGEMQRAAIARALVNDPAVIIADEPTGNLDSRTGIRILEMIAGLHRKRKKTVIMATHSRDANALADRLLQMLDGKLMNA